MNIVMIAIVDYGAGNLKSVCKALEFLGHEAVITNTSEEILKADRIILPGVGAFGDAVRNFRTSGVEEAILKSIESGKPFLGICLGMQLLFEGSEESPEADGLGIFKGKVVKFPEDSGLKIPQTGWNSLKFTKKSRIFDGLGGNADGDAGANPFVYFVHSYYIKPEDEGIVSSKAFYGVDFTASVESGNIFGVQFHPEKSGRVGLKMLDNFARIGE